MCVNHEHHRWARNGRDHRNEISERDGDRSEVANLVVLKAIKLHFYIQSVNEEIKCFFPSSRKIRPKSFIVRLSGLLMLLRLIDVENQIEISETSPGLSLVFYWLFMIHILVDSNFMARFSHKKSINDKKINNNFWYLNNLGDWLAWEIRNSKRISQSHTYEYCVVWYI